MAALTRPIVRGRSQGGGRGPSWRLIGCSLATHQRYKTASRERLSLVDDEILMSKVVLLVHSRRSVSGQHQS